MDFGESIASTVIRCRQKAIRIVMKATS